MRIRILTLAGAGAFALAEMAVPSAFAADNAKLSVLHAVPDLSNPDEKVLDLAAGTVSASVAAAGTTESAIGPADVNVAEGTNTIVYARGSLEDDNLKLAVQTISGLHSNPGGVNAGEIGLAADRNLAPLAALGAGLVAAALVIGRKTSPACAGR